MLVGSLIDRDIYPMVPVAAILFLRETPQPSRSRRARPVSHAAFAWLAVSAFVIAANSFTYDAVRWRAGEAAVAMGYDPRTVDAGYEWVGYHSTGEGTPAADSVGSSWYHDMLSSQPACAVLSNSPLDRDELRLVREYPSAYLQYGFFGPAQPLYLYGALADGCPVPPAAAARGMWAWTAVPLPK